MSLSQFHGNCKDHNLCAISFGPWTLHSRGWAPWSELMASVPLAPSVAALAGLKRSWICPEDLSSLKLFHQLIFAMKGHVSETRRHLLVNWRTRFLEGLRLDWKSKADTHVRVGTSCVSIHRSIYSWCWAPAVLTPAAHTSVLCFQCHNHHRTLGLCWGRRVGKSSWFSCCSLCRSWIIFINLFQPRPFTLCLCPRKGMNPV